MPYCSRTLVSARRLDPARLSAWLAGRDDVYRIKGWVRLGHDDVRLLQYAGGRLTWAPAESGQCDETRLVVIGRDGLPAAGDILDAIAVAAPAPGATDNKAEADPNPSLRA